LGPLSPSVRGFFTPDYFGVAFFHVPDIVWIYQKVTKHSVNFIATGKSFAASLHDRYGYSAEIRASKKKVESLMTLIVQQCPWIAIGFSNDLKKVWESQRAAFIVAVDERRKELAGAAPAGTV
jgi:hypothetical protein